MLRFGLAMALAKGAASVLPPVLLLDETLDHEDSRYVHVCCTCFCAEITEADITE